MGPARGVYVYVTRGSERIDALLSPRHQYPGESTVALGGSSCGWSERGAPLEGRSTERDLCLEGGALLLRSYREIHTFLANVDRRDYVCEQGAVLVPAAVELGARWSFRCDAGHTVETWSGGVVGRERHRLLGEGDALHLRFETELTGRTTGTSVKELWLREADLLVLEERVVNESATDTTIGDVHYLEEYSLLLDELAPVRAG